MIQDLGSGIKFNDTDGDLSIGAEVRRLTISQALALANALYSYETRKSGLAHKRSVRTKTQSRPGGPKK